jgi:hypothetical protein
MPQSPLSFGATSKFRHSLLIRNLPPYEDYKTTDLPGTYEFSMNDVGVIDPGNVEDLGNYSENKLRVLNKFNPENVIGFGDTVDININNQTETNQGEYDYLSSPPSLSTEQSQLRQLLQNLYGPPSGYQKPISIVDVNRLITQRNTYYKFIASHYGPLNILINDNPTGNNGTLSQDSSLAQIGAQSLKTEFEYRVAQETYSETLGRVNLLNALTDPYDALAIATGNEQVLESDWRISVPDSVVGKGLDFISRITGVYSPYSWIPGNYFASEDRKSLTNQVINSVTGLFTKKDNYKLKLPTNKSSYDTFLKFTGGGHKRQLRRGLRQNRYVPDYKLNFISEPNLLFPSANFYIGNRVTEATRVVSPENELPINQDGEKVLSPVRGYGEIAYLYENEINFKFGLNSYSFYDRFNALGGGFSWISEDSLLHSKPGVGNIDYSQSVDINESVVWDSNLESRGYDLKQGSILYNTQQLINAADRATGENKLKHVGNTINQVSKVFNDGTREITKGSRVLTYVDENNDIVAREYGRVFTKDRPYFRNKNLQKSSGITTENRIYSYSVLDNTYNLNIAPQKAGGDETSTNIKQEKVKKYMFSIENLAWRTSNQQGFTYQDLPFCERGPNGGRIMWFPPYDIRVSESNSANWVTNDFLGRPEPIFTYNNTTRNGNLSWKIVVDHPSIMNAIVDKELSNYSNEKVNGIIDSFMAGCRKYDMYELAMRFPQFKPNDIYEIIDKTTQIEYFESAADEIPKSDKNNTEPVTETYTNKITESDWGFSFHFDNLTPSVGSESSYKSILNSYITKKEDFVNNNTEENKSSVTDFFDNILPSINDKIKNLAYKIGDAVNDGAEIEIQLIGGNVPVDTTSVSTSLVFDNFNRDLSNRRFENIKNYILSLKDRNGKLLSKFEEKIKFNFKYVGDDYIPTTEEGGAFNCNTTLTGNETIYSPTGIWCRAITISDIKETKVSNNEENDFVPEEKVGDGGVNPHSDNKQSFVDYRGKALKRREEVGKIILKKLLNECDYFHQMNEETPMIYDGIKEKIKYFQPVFHSITPEGLNSRLTFLQQCIRPGDTIPVIGPDGVPRTDDAKNTSFGAPPICVLRIGDFYNTKIAINSINISYEPLVFDLNPEGIGVQPMIADISMSFYFIGGQGLKEPVSRLQNALSFNYYANTEVYDDRSENTDITEARQKINEDIWRRIEEEMEFGIESRNDEEDTSDGGNTIGSILETITYEDTFSGVTSYQKIMNEFLDKSKSYVDTLTSTFETVSETNSEIALYYLYKDRKYKYGQTFNLFDQPNAETIRIFGKVKTLEERINTLVSQVLQDVDDGTNPFVINIDSYDFRNADKRKYKRKLKEFIEQELKQKLINDLTSGLSNLEKVQTDLVRVMDKINLVASNTDGYRNKSKKEIIFDITPTSDIHETTTGSSDTREEMKNDVQVVGDDLIGVLDRILNEEDASAPSLLDSYIFNEGSFSSGFLSEDFDTPAQTRMCVLLYSTITNDSSSIVDYLLEGNLSEKPEWVRYVNRIIGTPEVSNNLPLILGSEGDSQILVESQYGLVDEYKLLGNNGRGKFVNFKNSEEISKFTTYSPFNKNKLRTYTYIQLNDETMDEQKKEYFNKIYKGENGGSPSTFNLKLNFK